MQHTKGTIMNSAVKIYCSIFFIGIIFLNTLSCTKSPEQAIPEKPIIIKLGTLDCEMMESTPVVFNGKLYRYEYIHKFYKPNKTGDTYFRFIDVETGTATPAFAAGYHLGNAYAQDGTMYVYGIAGWGNSHIQVFRSTDLVSWETQTALDIPGWGLYNNSVCEARDRYIMAFEVGEPPEIAGKRFTTRFAESTDLLNWELMPEQYVYTKEKYSACPALKYIDGIYYMIYLEARPGPEYESHMVRSRDLIEWENSPFNPVLQHSPEDKRIANPNLSEEQKEGIAKAKNINNSDMDLCEFEGKVIIYYSWGNQNYVDHLALAEYEGSLESFLKGFFP